MTHLRLSGGTWRITSRVVTVLVIGFIFSGAQNVTSELLDKPRRQEEVRSSVKAWAEAVLLELPPQHERKWEELAESHPELMLKICSRGYEFGPDRGIQ